MDISSLLLFSVDISGRHIIKYFSHRHKLHFLLTFEYDRACLILRHLMLYRNTLKLSYSCMSNIKTIISSHNKAQINKSDAINDSNCNCRNSSTCPMDGKCNDQSIIYQAEVTTSTSKETYIGLCDTAFKLRYRNHVCSFRNERYKHATELSKYIWNLKDRNIMYNIKWRKIKQARSYSNVSKKCNLCL